MSAESARQRATEATREADRAELTHVGLNEGLWRTGAALANDRSMPERRSGLARGRVQRVQNKGEPAAQRHPPVAGNAHQEA